jgi:hypothetical protein
MGTTVLCEDFEPLHDPALWSEVTTATSPHSGQQAGYPSGLGGNMLTLLEPYETGQGELISFWANFGDVSVTPLLVISLMDADGLEFGFGLYDGEFRWWHSAADMTISGNPAIVPEADHWYCFEIATHGGDTYLHATVYSDFASSLGNIGRETWSEVWFGPTTMTLVGFGSPSNSFYPLWIDDILISTGDQDSLCN